MASIITQVKVDPFYLAYQSILSARPQGISMVKFWVGSEHSFTVDGSVIHASFLKVMPDFYTSVAPM